MKTIGLIGGMSWESTTLYYQAINREVARRRGGLTSAPMVVLSLDFEDITRRQQQPKRSAQPDHPSPKPRRKHTRDRFRISNPRPCNHPFLLYRICRPIHIASDRDGNPPRPNYHAELCALPPPTTRNHRNATKFRRGSKD